MDPISALLINRVLDGLSMRQQATAHNIANAGSPGFRPIRVTFEDALRDAAALGPDAISRISPRMTESQAAPGEMRLDLELATAAETGLRYGALIDLLGRQMAISRAAIRGGQ
jgi:flagellar basal-body rod protein FlgB